MMNMKALIFDIERNSYVDGPGIRTTVFFKGCNLRCAWCHNPESQKSQKELLFYPNKCTGCGRCKDLCADNEGFLCFNGAKEICGKQYNVDEILHTILKDKTFYLNSGGGVTFSGGECMLQIDFLADILKACKQNGIHIIDKPVMYSELIKDGESREQIAKRLLDRTNELGRMARAMDRKTVKKELKAKNKNK